MLRGDVSSGLLLHRRPRPAGAPGPRVWVGACDFRPVLLSGVSSVNNKYSSMFSYCYNLAVYRPFPSFARPPCVHPYNSVVLRAHRAFFWSSSLARQTQELKRRTAVDYCRRFYWPPCCERADVGEHKVYPPVSTRVTAWHKASHCMPARGTT